jgi:hypothetical protein
MQREGHLGLQQGPPLQQRAQLEDTREGHLGLQHGPPLQHRAQLEDPRFPQRDHTFQHVAPFQGVNYLDERSPLVSGTIIRGTLKTPNSQLVTPISIKLQKPDGCD